MKRIAIFLLTMLTFCMSYAYKQESIDITVNGKTRNMVVFTPDASRYYMPLMIVTHGMNQSPEYQYDSDKLWKLIDTEKFVVAYLRSDGSTWDTGGTNDQNFVLQTITEMNKRYGINKNRVYWSGFSMGSMLIYHCIGNVQNKIAAFAPTSGVQFSEQPWNNCKKPVNLIHCHAYGDDVFPYQDPRYKVHEYVENMALKVNGNTDYKKTLNYKVNSSNFYDGDKEVWSGGTKGGEVELYFFNNGGHWPMDGNAREIWNFCSRFSLKTVAEEYKEIYEHAESLIAEWAETPEMTEKTIYKSLKGALETYAPETLTSDVLVTKATTKLILYITNFESTAAKMSQRTDGGEMEQPTEFNPNFHIYLCFGQSNMEGNAKVEAQDRVGVNPRFRMMAAVNMPTYSRTKSKWYIAYPPLCRDWTGLTPADYFGRTMVEKLPEEVSVGVINVAVGGCSIELFDEDECASIIKNAKDQWFKDYCKEYNNNPFRTLMTLAKKAQKVGVIKGILLHQGCSNNGDPDWPQKVKRIYLRMLKELGLTEEETPLLIGELEQSNMGGICSGHNAVIAQTPGAIPNAHVISSANCPGNGEDGFHFSAEGYRMIGKRYAEAMYPLLGVTKQIDFDTSETPFPLTNQAFSPSLYLSGSFKATSKLATFTSEQAGNFGGWRYSKGIDISGHKYLVVKFFKAPTCNPVLKIYDTDDYLKACFSYEIGKAKTAVIDLQDTHTPAGATVDLSHVYLLGFETDATQPLYIESIYLSDDGETPSTEIRNITVSTPKDNSYYDMTGRRVPVPTRGIYIQNGKKVFVR